MKRLFQRCLISGVAVAMSLGCGVDEEGAPPPSDKLYFPLGLAAHPDGQYLLVSNSVFDRKYNQSFISVVDTFKGEILSDLTTEVDLFSGEIKLTKTCSSQSSPVCQSRVIGIVPSRDLDTLTSFELSTEGDKLKIKCGQAEGSNRCGGKFVQHSGLKESSSAAPYSLTLNSDVAYLSHINSGAVSSWYVSDLPPFISFGCQLQLPGANYVSDHPQTSGVVISDRFGRSLHHVERVPIGESRCQLRLLDQLGTSSALNSESRGVAFSADGSQLYVVNSADGALRVYASLLRPDGNLFTQQVATFPVGEDGNIVRVAGDYKATEDSIGAQPLDRIQTLGEGLVYVTSLRDGTVTVIDPVQLRVLSRIEVGRGAHDISFMLSEEGELRGYVSLFEEHKIIILDLQPGSSQRFTVIGEID